MTTHSLIMDALKNWLMVIIALIFVLLYTVALLGWLKPLSDVTMVTRLEPIIFIIIGYYFGRLPGQQNEQSLKEEINRQTKKIEAAQHSREQTQQEREALEERLKNVKTILTGGRGAQSKNSLSADKRVLADESSLESLKNSVKSAVNILNS